MIPSMEFACFFTAAAAHCVSIFSELSTVTPKVSFLVGSDPMSLSVKSCPFAPFGDVLLDLFATFFLF